MKRLQVQICPATAGEAFGYAVSGSRASIAPIEKAVQEVAGEVRRLFSVTTGELKRAEIQQAFGLKHEDHFRDAYLMPTLTAQVIKMNKPDKPLSKKQRYRLTECSRSDRLGDKKDEEIKP